MLGIIIKLQGIKKIKLMIIGSKKMILAIIISWMPARVSSKDHLRENPRGSQ
jgi:hypothetical protein